MEESKRTDWKRFAFVGCGCLLACALSIGVVVALNWKRVSGFVSETAGVLSELYVVQRALQEKVPGANVTVHLENDAVKGDSLRIEVVNEALVDFDRARAQALELAVVARDASPQGSGYPRYEIVFKTEAGTLVRLSNSQSHRFTASDLPPAPPR